jgi:hypothetical protein
MKLKIVALALIMFTYGNTSAQAATITDKVTVNNKVALTYTVENSVTLSPAGCEEVYIQYTIDKSYFFPNSYVMFGLYSAQNNEAQSIYVKPGTGKGNQGDDAWVGKKEMIFCGKTKSYVNDYGDKVVAPAFSKGTYTFTARLTILKPKLSTTQSKKITFTVK